MKTINNFIVEHLEYSTFPINEKLKISSHTNDSRFTDEELRKDYEAVSWAITKAEKQPYKDKYNVSSNKFRDIQLVILDELRKNRKHKDSFDINDIRDFTRYDMKEREYTEYLDEEPIEFVKVMYDHSLEVLKKRKINPNLYNYYGKNSLSIADRYNLKKYNQLRAYLTSHNVTL